MKNLFRIHFTAIAVMDLLLLVFFSTRSETAFDWLLLTGFIFLLAQGLLLFRLVNRLKKHFSEIDPQMNKKIRLYYLEILSADPLLFVFLAITGPQHFYSLTPVFTSCHSTFYYTTTNYLRDKYPDFYGKHISLWKFL